MNENGAGGELLKLCSMLFLLSSDKNSYYLLNVFDRLPNPLWCLHWPRWESILTGVLIVQIHEYYMISLKSHRCCGVLNLDQYDQNAIYFLYGIILFLGTFVLFLKFKIIYSKLYKCLYSLCVFSWVLRLPLSFIFSFSRMFSMHLLLFFTSSFPCYIW